MNSPKLRYPSLRHVKRTPNNGPCYDNGYADSFYVIGYGIHHGYGKRMRFLCSAWSSLDAAIVSRDKYAEHNPGYSIRIRHGVNDRAGKFFDGVTLSIPDNA